MAKYILPITKPDDLIKTCAKIPENVKELAGETLASVVWCVQAQRNADEAILKERYISKERIMGALVKARETKKSAFNNPKGIKSERYQGRIDLCNELLGEDKG